MHVLVWVAFDNDGVAGRTIELLSNTLHESAYAERATFPMLSRINPFGDARVEASEVGLLAREIEKARTDARFKAAARDLAELSALAREAQSAGLALVFLGD